MDLLIEKSSYRENDLTALLSMFVFTLLLSFVKLFDTSLCFTLPMFIVAFACGHKYIGVYFVSVFFSVAIDSNNQLLLIISFTSYLILQAGVYLKFVKLKYIAIIMSLIATMYLYIYGYDLTVVWLIAVVVLLQSHLYLELAPIFIHRTIDVFTNRRLMILTIVIMLCIASLLEINKIYMLVILRFYTLLSVYYLGINVVMPSILYISIILVIQNFALKDDVLSLLLPFSIFFMYNPDNKLKCVTIYLMSHLILPFFVTYDYYYHGFMIIVSALLFIVAPKINIKKEMMLDEYKETSSKTKLIQKANTFASLFKQLTTIFKEENSITQIGEYAGYIYEDVCSRCSSKEYCYYSKDGINRLAKLINKGMHNEYSKEDIKYIKEHCINPKDYLINTTKYRESYQKSSRINKENQFLKNELFDEFSLLSNIFDNFSNSVNNTNINEQHIKEHLLGYKFNIVFLKKQIRSMNTYTLEIGIINTTKHEIIEELLPILETYLNESLEIISLKDSMHHLGYTSVILKHDLNYVLQYGFQQHSLDPTACGDSHIVFNSGNQHYLAISDGMGQGIDASKESKLTLEVLSKLVLNGVDLKDTLNSINTLLRIKNHSDMFTTLDLCNINLANAKTRIIKYGANNSYHIRYGEIEEISCKSLPVGIVSNITMTSYELMLKDEDILIMVSDGVGDNFKGIVNEALPIINDFHPQEIATLLMNRVIDENNLDDISIMVIKIVKQE